MKEIKLKQVGAKIEESLIRELKVMAAQEDKTLTEVLNEVIRIGLKK